MTDHDLQALLSGDLDAADLDARLDAQARTPLSAYREVQAALETPPDAFAPGFADRVMTAVAARETARPNPFPTSLVWATVAAALGWLALRTEVLAVVLGDARSASVPDVTGAMPYVVLTLALLTATEALDRLRHRGAQPT